MTTPLREALELIARDVPALGDLEQAIQAGQARRRTRWIAAATGAAAAVAVVLAVWGSGALTTTPEMPPIAPPTGQTPWPASVDIVSNPQALQESPLRTGAAMAVVHNGDLVLVHGAEQRLAATTERHNIGNVAVTPDGLLVAYSHYGYGSASDFMTVVDVTSGQTILNVNVLTPAGEGSQTWRLDWSADGRRLVQIVPRLGTARQEEGGVEIRVWERRAGSLEQIATLTDLPGPYIGISPDGSQIAAVSGRVVSLSNVTLEDWVTTTTTVAPRNSPDAPDSDLGWGGGQNRWAPDGSTLGWGFSSGGPADPIGEIRWVDIDTSTWLVGYANGASSLRFVGWREGQPVVQLGSGDGADATPAVPSDIVVVKDDRSLQVICTLRAASGRIGEVSVAQDQLP